LAKLLVVDDERDVADALKMGLESKGFKVDVFYDPVQAVASFEHGAYDLVVSDIKMPKMNGFEMIYEMRKIDQTVPIIFLTGYVDMMNEVNKLFTKMNVREVIQKPIGIQQLAEKINSLNLGLKASAEEPR
jgi:DNA-binding response OmpR family regulator